jgi:CRISPR-associated protein Csx17
MNRLVLEGCQPEPLMSYLKSLGILRLVTQQKDPEARGAWVDGRFVLTTHLDMEGLVQFLLHDYCPTPIANPWNGGSGFYPPDEMDEALLTLLRSETPRFAIYRMVLSQIVELLAGLNLKEQPSGDAKGELQQKLRNNLHEAYIPWIDSAVVIIKTDDVKYPPILGSGGNDGRLDFSMNFMKRLIGLGLVAGQPNEKSEAMLRNTLLGTPTGALGGGAVGQFNPGRAGGPNSTQGMEGNAADNPWDFVLMLEGVMLFTGTAARRLAAAGQIVARFPFSVDAVAAEASIEAKEAREPKGELWLPLWSRSSSLRELIALLNEGRADVGSRSAKSGVDFARAIASLGIDRGIDAFCRMGFLIRNGLSAIVTPLGQFPVRQQADVDLLRELDPWLVSLRILARDDKAPTRFATAMRRIDVATMAFCRQGGPARLADIVMALGDAFAALRSSPKYREKFRGIPRLSSRWIDAANDNSIEFRLAVSLAGIYDASHNIGPMACHVLPLKYEKYNPSWETRTPLDCTWSSGPLATNLAMVLKRRLIDAVRHNTPQLPLMATNLASLSDVLAFLAGTTDDSRLERLLHGMLAIRQERDQLPHQPTDYSMTPFAFALVRPLFASTVIKLHRLELPSAPQQATLAALMGHNLPRALELASRRIRHSGLTPLGSSRTGRHAPLTDATGVDPIRLAATCLFGLSVRDLAGLLHRVVRVPQEQGEPV